MEIYVEKVITRFEAGDRDEVKDFIAVERRLVLFVNNVETLSLYCSPVMVRELVTGFLMTEGIIKGSWCTEKMVIEHGESMIRVSLDTEAEVSTTGRTITSGCVGGVTFARPVPGRMQMGDFTVSPDILMRLFRVFQSRSDSYRNTGCIHSAALADCSSLLVLAEDIGRHNAVDKVIGHCLINDIPFTDKILLLSGRLSSEIGTKCSRWEIPVVVSRTAPTLLSVSIAQERGITMVGFMRGERFNVYSHPHRIS
ncbi:MAG: formate dehydrogenase accessory sulfurtransferase FdhD [Nitrospirae bacterium]|nr:formate dehydrogenase accessory sulfurtransferase FdhD [Nitrospirota bacterium]